MNKIEQLKKLVDEICEEYTSCKYCPLYKHQIPYPHNLLCEIILDLNEGGY